ncbi:MAG: PD-(D/E)XK nuclease family protein [Clostridium sp.]
MREMRENDIYKYSMLFDSVEFQLLNKKLNKFNAIKVLNSAKYEIRHSNVIGWLLDPNENHEMREYFLQAFIAKCLSKEENIEKIIEMDLSINQIIEIGKSDIEIKREEKTANRRFIDLLVISKNKKFIILIENKFKAKESENQLKDYLEYVKDRYEEYSILPVFLTLNGDEASLNEYVNLEYKDIVEILKRYLLLNGEKVERDIRYFLNNYINIIENEVLGNEEEIELATNLYREYENIIREDFKELNLSRREMCAIDFIRNNGNRFMIQAFEKFNKENRKNIIKSKSGSKLCSFILEGFAIKDLETIENWWFNFPFIMWFEKLGDGRLKLTLELGPIEYSRRIDIIERLENYGIKISNQAKRPESKYTRLYSKAVLVDNWTDEEEIYRKMIGLYLDLNLIEKIKIIDKIKEDLI